MKSLRKIFRRGYFRQVVIYVLTWCLVLNTSLPVVLATPSGGGFTVGTGSITQSGNATNVVVDQTQSVIEWNSLDTLGGLPADRESLNFFDGGYTNAAVLNRVMSGYGTQFFGDLNADAGMRIFIVNPAGIVFGEGSTVNVTQLVASNLNITNDNFLSGNYEFAGDIDSVDTYYERLGVVNKGTITTIPGAEGVTEGVALIGKKIRNIGTITAGPGGFVVMAAGDRVLLGQPGSKILVEMDSLTPTAPTDPEAFDEGDVINEYVDETQPGQITADGGTIVLASGDIFSVPLHPQLKVNTGTDEVPEYDPAAQPVRVESGIGTVTQSGTISADGGSVILTAGNANLENDDVATLDDDIPDVVLSSGSVTQATDGEVITYAYDFGTEGDTGGAITSFEDGATINVGTGTAEISGNHILFGGSVNAEPGGTIMVDPVNLRIADTMPVTGPELDTLYEEDVEDYSKAGINLDLAADNLITVEYMADGEITGGSGDISLRNVFGEGGIYFEQADEDGHTGPRSSIHTTAYYVTPEVHRDGGSIYMDAGSGGIVAGDLFTDTLSQDKVSEPGEIVLRTAISDDPEGSDIEVGTMRATGASNTQVSAISGGDLTVNGDVESINKQTDNDDQTVGKATGCLIAEGDIHLNGDSYKVYSHGKEDVVADIRISAGGNVYIGSEQNPAMISAEAKVAQSTIATKSTAYIVIDAGRNLSDPGEININGNSYTPGTSYMTDGFISATALMGDVDTSTAPTSTDGTKSVWENISDPVSFFAKIEINSQETVPLDEGPCKDCPQPPGLPPIPHIFVIANDDFTIGWAAENAPLDVLANDDNGNPLVDGNVSEYTSTAGGTLTKIMDGGKVIGFEYTPPEDAVFVWDGVSDYAEYTDTFTYKAKDSEGNESVNTATVTINATNFLPTLSGDSDTIHMSSESNPTSTSFDLDGLIVDPDGSPQSLITGYDDSATVGGTVSLNESIATYDPYNGFATEAGTPDTFQYTAVDNQIVDKNGDPVVLSDTIEVTVDNALPSGDGWIGMVENNSTDNTQNNLADGFNYIDADMLGDEFLDTHQLIPGTYTGSQGGTLIISYDEGTEEWTYDYTPAAGYEGDNVDDWFDPAYSKGANPDEAFNIPVWDGQLDYYVEGDPVPVYGEGTIYADIKNSPVPPPAPVPYIPPAPGLQREVLETSGCPALAKWAAAELGTDEGKIEVWMANSVALGRGIQPCDACASLKEAATVLQDSDGSHLTALAQVISQYASSTAPPTEEQMASIADAIANDLGGNVQYAAAGEYLDALAKYVGILTSEMGYSADQAVQLATDNYVQKLTEGDNMGVATYVAARLAALAGS